MSKKLTKWYQGDQKPVRVGVYERDIKAFGKTYSKWDGKNWRCIGWSPDDAENWSFAKSAYQNSPWRGLASNPAAK